MTWYNQLNDNQRRAGEGGNGEEGAEERRSRLVVKRGRRLTCDAVIVGAGRGLTSGGRAMRAHLQSPDGVWRPRGAPSRPACS